MSQMHRVHERADREEESEWPVNGLEVSLHYFVFMQLIDV